LLRLTLQLTAGQQPVKASQVSSISCSNGFCLRFCGSTDTGCYDGEDALQLKFAERKADLKIPV
jgi:hypothetical protein